MQILHSTLLLLALFAFNSYACDAANEKSDCGDGSEYTWNPSNANTSAKLERFYALDELIDKQYADGNYVTTRELVNEYLQLASIYKNNWNYGNAIHDANRILGLISYQEENLPEATKYLIQSGTSPGSPQLNSFGPVMDLANLLLKEGKTEAVKSYLNGISLFWEMDNGAVEGWLRQIERGKKPELDRFESIRREM